MNSDAENLTNPELPKRGWLMNGNPSGDFLKARRRGAKNRQGKPKR
jgi:hypothetical protein